MAQTASRLGVIKVIQNVNAVHTQESITLEKLTTDHPELFNKVGKM